MVYGRDRVINPGGIECIEVTQHLSFCLGNAVKLIWIAGLEGDNAEEYLTKAVWYLEQEISRISEVSNDTEDKDYDPWDALRDFFDDDDEDTADDCAPVDWDSLRDDEDEEESEYYCGAFSCDCDGSCFNSDKPDEDEDPDDTEDTAQHRDDTAYSDGRRVTVAELRERLAGDATGEDPLQLLVTSILYHTLTDNLPDAFADD